jgi:beta-mannosidase
MSSTPAAILGASRQLREGWTMSVLPPGEAKTPEEARVRGQWMSATVPGTASQSFTIRNAPDVLAPAFHDNDLWYRCEIDVPAGTRLRFEGLATIAEIYLDSLKLAESNSMFAPVEIHAQRSGRQELAIAFRSLTSHLAGLKGRRARWKTLLADKPSLRFVRTTLLGHMPGWCPQVDIVGPYREITSTPPDVLTTRDVQMSSRLEGTVGVLTATIPAKHTPYDMSGLELRCAGRTAPFMRYEDAFKAELHLPDIDIWMPHTHGSPVLHDVSIAQGESELHITRTGFRKIEIDRGEDGSRFNFVINGQRVFARGACWTPPDVNLSSNRESYRRELLLMRDAGMNMIRIPGITLYESNEFYELTDDLGMMVWQELPFANFDYPFEDPAFQTLAQREFSTFLERTQSFPSLVAVCGGSEVAQQAAMMGLPESIWQDCTNAACFRDIAKSLRPHVVYIDNSPSDGALPFHVDQGIGHYYGVGAYLRPLEDARRADVAFAAECLAFSHIPDTLEPGSDDNAANINHPDWKKGIPRDRGASWDFEDVREHYTRLLYGIDCAQMRLEDPDAYLAYARATTVEVLEATYAEWRRPKSRTGGALAFLWKDLKPGAGWGLIDSQGRPKAAWHAMRRACRPLNLMISDEGVNGLHIHIINEAEALREVTVDLSCHSPDGHIVVDGESTLPISSRQSLTLNAVELIGAFFDVNHAYRFGPPAHNVVRVGLRDANTQELLAEAFHFPQGRAAALQDCALTAALVEQAHGPALKLSSKTFAQTVAIDAPGFLPGDNYFHLAPGSERIIPLAAGDNSSQPGGTVRALNFMKGARF